MAGNEFFRFEQVSRAELPCCASPLSPISPELHVKQLWQAAQLDRQNPNRKDVVHLGLTALLELANRRAMLLAVTEDRLDYLANHLANLIPRMPGSALVDSAVTFDALAGLGGESVSVACHVRRDLDLAASLHKPGSVVILVSADGLAPVPRQTIATGTGVKLFSATNTLAA